MRIWTWYNCSAKEMVVEGLRTDGKCHNCKETVHLVEKSVYDAIAERARKFCTEIDTRWEPALRKAKYDYERELKDLSLKLLAAHNEIEELMKVDYWQDRYNVVKNDLEAVNVAYTLTKAELDKTRVENSRMLELLKASGWRERK